MDENKVEASFRNVGGDRVHTSEIWFQLHKHDCNNQNFSITVRWKIWF